MESVKDNGSGILDFNTSTEVGKSATAGLPRSPCLQQQEDLLTMLALFQSTNDRTYLRLADSHIKEILQDHPYEGHGVIELLFTRPEDVDDDTADEILEVLDVSQPLGWVSASFS